MTDENPDSPIEALLRLPSAIVHELGAVLPRLADRTRAQVDFAATVIEKLRCGDLGSRLSSAGTAVPEKLADVVPFEPRSSLSGAADAAAAPSPVREVIDVVTVAASPRVARTEPTESDTIGAPAKKSPARKAPAAKKAPAARKAPAAKKAPAKKARAVKKAPAAKKAPAKKAPAAKKSPPRQPAPVASRATAQTALSEATESETTVTAVDASAPTASPVADIRVPAEAGSLAIPGYDALAASQVMPRLESLTPEDLEQIRTYEAAGRGRRTILSRIAQLQAG